MENHEQNLEYKCSVCNKDFSEVTHLLIFYPLYWCNIIECSVIMDNDGDVHK